MNALTLHGGNADNLTMTSREIAELTGKEHRNVMADIRKMLVELHGEGGLLNFQQSYINEQNKAQPCFNLPKRETLILVSGYSVQMRAKIIDRWQELEAKVGAGGTALNPANLSRLQLIEMAMQAEQERLQLEQKVEVLAPKAEALDRIADADGSMNLTVASKSLQEPPKKFFSWMREHRWIYRKPGGSGNVAYQDKIQAGYLTHKVTTVQREDGTDKVVEQVLVTAKGLAKLAQAFGRPLVGV